MPLKAASRIDHSTHRLRARNLPDGQLWIVRYRRPDTNNNNVNQRTQSVKMLNSSGAIDVL
jgi:hypothetical protein